MHDRTLGGTGLMCCFRAHGACRMALKNSGRILESAGWDAASRDVECVGCTVVWRGDRFVLKHGRLPHMRPSTTEQSSFHQ